MWAKRSKPTNDSDIVSRWIYIQRPASIFNLSSSSSSAVGTTSRLLLLAALLSMLRCEALPYRRPGHPSTPPHLLFFSTDYRTTPHQNQLTLVHLSVCDSTPASSHLRLVAVQGLAVVHHLGCARRGVVNVVNERHPLWTIRGEADSWVHGRTQGNASLLRAK